MGDTPSSAISPVDPTRLEFLRAGIGLLLDTEEGVVQVVYVSRGADDRTATWECTCRRGRQGRACKHVRVLEAQVDACHELWGGRSWQPLLERTGWHRLGRACFEGARTDCAASRALAVSAEGVEGYRIESPDGDLLALVPRTDGGARLLDRCGVFRLGQAEGSRARLLAHLQRLQCSDGERAMNDRGVKTARQAFEDSFHYRLAYHALREWGEQVGTFHPLVDTATADFLLVHRAPDGQERLRFAVPRGAVETVLGLLRALQPDRRDLDVQPIPLRSLFKVTRATELDVDVRPLIEVLQRGGESRFFEREEVERFRYGRLVYLPELQVLAELEQPGRERKFVAPTRMTLEPSRVPAFVQEMQTQANVVVDASLRTLRVFRELEGLSVEPLSRDSEGYWMRLSCRFGGAPVALPDLLHAKSRRLTFLDVPGGWIDLLAPALDPLWSLAARTQPDRLRDDAVHLSSHEVLRLATTVPARPEVAPDAPAAEPLRQLLAMQPTRHRSTPAGLRSPLRPYQQLGVDWLFFLYDNGLAGLLCDEMGLGKTHQVMAFLLSLLEHEALERPFLVVAPTSVVSHWRDKLRQHAPGLSATIYHGADRALPSQPPRGHVVVTSYGVLRNDLERLARLPFAVAVFDEVQQLKNRETHAHRAAMALEAPMKIGLTGTPIENDEEDLRALVDVVLPGRLDGPLSARRLSPFVLRRVKQAVLHELPDKIEDVRRCALSDEQRRLYREAIDTRGAALRAQLLQSDRPVPYLHVFALLNQLKRICDHPALALNRPADYRDSISGKWEVFTEILGEALDAGQKVVVFSQYLGMLEIIERHLRAEGIGHAKLTGATSDRGRVVSRFNGAPDCRVFLGSLKAGGTGIDLVGGSVVVHYDRWWNAAREDQATDRVHRIGQRRAVQVFKLLAEGTLEERIDAIIDRKRRLLAETVAVDDPHLPKVFSREELLELLRGLDPADAPV
jgi:superfamily II DNA or RNA helicase